MRLDRAAWMRAKGTVSGEAVSEREVAAAAPLEMPEEVPAAIASARQVLRRKAEDTPALHLSSPLGILRVEMLLVEASGEVVSSARETEALRSFGSGTVGMTPMAWVRCSREAVAVPRRACGNTAAAEEGEPETTRPLPAAAASC